MREYEEIPVYTQEGLLKKVKQDEKFAKIITEILHKHNVNPEDFGSTAHFLSNIIGAIILYKFPENKHKWAINDILEEIKYGIQMGLPEE